MVSVRARSRGLRKLGVDVLRLALGRVSSRVDGSTLQHADQAGEHAEDERHEHGKHDVGKQIAGRDVERRSGARFEADDAGSPNDGDQSRHGEDDAGGAEGQPEVAERGPRPQLSLNGGNAATATLAAFIDVLQQEPHGRGDQTQHGLADEVDERVTHASQYRMHRLSECGFVLVGRGLLDGCVEVLGNVHRAR